MDKQALAKHHFWILFGATPVLIGVGFLVMWLLASGAVAEQQKKYDELNKELGMPAKSSGELTAIGEKKNVISGQRGELWASNYERQLKAGVFDWPIGGSRELQTHSEKKYKFGSAFLPIRTELTKFVLEKAFNEGYGKLNGEIAPTRFTGGSWESAVRYVTNWGDKQVPPAVLWLALEDYWVQKALLQPIAQVNREAARFVDITPKTADNPLKRKFKNRVWELDLEVREDGKRKMIGGQIRNTTDRLQVVGMNKSMKVNLWLDDPKGEQPDFVLTVQGENVPGLSRLNITERELVNVPTVTRLARVEQVFDEATVPIRLVNTLELGMLDHKNKNATLEPPKHIEEDPSLATAADPNAPGGGTGGIPGGGGMIGAGAGGPSSGEGGGENAGYGPPGAGGTTAKKGAKKGTPTAVLLGNRLRYLKRTEDVRRMPVALSVVIDRDFINDLLIAYSNSVLRMQVTQTQWQRFRGTLPAVGASGSTSDNIFGDPGDGGIGAPGGTGSPDGGEADRRGGGEQDERRGGGKFSPPSPGGGGAPGGGAAVSDDNIIPAEAGSGLVEFAIFGVVSLYEKKEAPKPADGQPLTPAPEQPAPPMDPAAPTDKPAGKPMGEKPADKPADKPKDDKPMGDKPPADKPGGAPTPPAK
jgi:hypothetical protein